MPYKATEIASIAEEVLQEFILIESDFGKEVSDAERRAIKFAVTSTLTKSLPF